MNNFLKKPAGIAGLTVLLVIFDQFTKYLAVLFLKDQDPFVILPGVFELHYLENRGAAFGMMQGQQTFFLIIGILVFAGGIYLFRHMSEEPEFWPSVLLPFPFWQEHGAICWIASVSPMWVDFFYFKLIDFPIFKVADIYCEQLQRVVLILIGFVLLQR